MVINLRCKVGLFPQAPKPARWKTKNVNWNAFNEALESDVALWEILPTIGASVKRFTEALTEVGKAHVGKTKPGKRKKVGLSLSVRLLVKKRSNLRKLVRTRREEWVAACGEVASVVEQEKEKSWTEFVETLENQKDYAKTWCVVGVISDSSDSCSPNKSIGVGAKILTSNPSKADGFAAHYAKVSKVSFSAEERSRIRLAKRTVNSPSADDSTTADFSIVDLNRALKKMTNCGAAGSDEVPPTFLKNLGTNAMTELLRVFNMSFREAVVPQVWLNAVIIPLLKSGKPASSIESYRSVSLTSCIVKLLERMIFHHLYNLAESRGMCCHTQAGFRKNRSCEDQLIRISQNISDGFQECKPKRTVMALLDLSRAYDRVWKEHLLLCLFESGVPQSFIRWI